MAAPRLAVIGTDRPSLSAIGVSRSSTAIFEAIAARDSALQSLISEHGVQIKQFPDEILEAGAKAATELLTEIREGGDALTKKTAESFISALNVVRQKTEGTDSLFLAARQKYFTLS